MLSGQAIKSSYPPAKLSGVQSLNPRRTAVNSAGPYKKTDDRLSASV